MESGVSGPRSSASGAAGLFFHLQPLWWKVERREASMHALGDWVSGISISEKGENERRRSWDVSQEISPRNLAQGRAL